MSQRSTIREMIQDAIGAGLSVVEIVHEPDGTIRVLTKPKEGPVNIDPLAEARAKREAKGQGNANSYKEAG